MGRPPQPQTQARADYRRDPRFCDTLAAYARTSSIGLVLCCIRSLIGPPDPRLFRRPVPPLQTMRIQGRDSTSSAGRGGAGARCL